MPLCYPSTFIPDGVNITKQMERIAFVINKLSFVTNDTRPAISYENINDLARSEKASLEPPEPLRNRFESGKRNEENAETAFASYTAKFVIQIM
jgi:hypothetical protein